MAFSKRRLRVITIVSLLLIGRYLFTQYHPIEEQAALRLPSSKPTSSQALEIPTSYPKGFIVEPSDVAPMGTHDLHALRNAMRRNTSEFKVKTNNDGSEVVRLNGAYHTISAARRLPDGTLLIGCFESSAAIEDFLNKPGSTQTLDAEPQYAEQ
jgi:hypothetical protein